MSIYLAASSPNASATHPLFKQRGIEGLTHAAANQLGIHGRAFLREVAYDGYFRNIDVFLAATNRKVKVPTHTEDAELVMEDIEELFPITIPPIIILPARKLSAEQEDSFLHKLRDCDPIKKVQGNTTIFILNKPDIRKAMVYLRASQENVIAPEGVWTPAMFASLAALITIITEFLKTNTYPAFLSPDNRGEHDGGEFYLDANMVSNIKIQQDQGYVAKKLRTETDEGGMEDVDEDEDTVMEDDGYEMSFTDMRRAVLVAKPSPLPLSYNLGAPSEVPELPGRVFPYFDRMIIPDNYTIRSIISAFFLRNLGTTRDEQVGCFKAMRLGWERVAKTPQGGILTHVLVGMRLSLETQTRMFCVLRDQQYCGFVLLGAMWSVTVDNRYYEWESEVDVRHEVNKMSSHIYAVGVICGVLSKLKVIVAGHAGPAQKVEVEDVKSASALWKKIAEREFSMAAEEDVRRVLGLVSYVRDYRKTSPESLIWLLQMVTDETKDALAEDQPLYLSPTFSLYNDRLFQLLCSFGPDAPSLYNASGSSFTIPRSPVSDPNEVLDGKGKKALPHLLVSLKSVQVAYQDLRKVLKDRVIRIDLGERAGRNRNLCVTGEWRDRVYESLRECLNVGEAAGVKRKGAEVPEGKGKRRVTVKDADDLLSLFD